MSRGLTRAGVLAGGPEVWVYGPPTSGRAQATTGEAPGLVGRRLRAGGPAGRLLLEVPWVARRDGLALWHAAWAAPAPWARVPVVLSVHDVLFATHPALFTPARAALLRRVVAWSARRAARVVVPTRATRDALLATWPWLDPARVVHVAFGVDRARFRPLAPAPEGPTGIDGDHGDVGAGGLAADDARRRAALGLPAGPWVLFVGRPDPRKGLDDLLVAVAGLPDLGLVVAGPLGAARAALCARAAGLGLGPDRFAARDHVADDDLPALYRGCLALALPSRGEGVGVPVLEALACGAPVVVSDDPALRETAGQRAAAVVPAGDPRALRDALAALRDAPASARARAAGAATRGAEGARDAGDLARDTVAVYRAALRAP